MHRTAAVLAAPAAAALMLILAACGSGSPAAEPAASAAGMNAPSSQPAGSAQPLGGGEGPSDRQDPAPSPTPSAKQPRANQPSDKREERQAARAAYRECLEKNGAGRQSSGPSASPQASRPSRDAVQAAKEKCADLRRSSDSTNVPFDDAGRAALAACLKENGATLRSDKFPLMGLNRRDPKTEAALEACRTLLPGRAPRPSPS